MEFQSIGCETITQYIFQPSLSATTETLQGTPFYEKQESGSTKTAEKYYEQLFKTDPPTAQEL